MRRPCVCCVSERRARQRITEPFYRDRSRFFGVACVVVVGGGVVSATCALSAGNSSCSAHKRARASRPIARALPPLAARTRLRAAKVSQCCRAAASPGRSQRNQRSSSLGAAANTHIAARTCSAKAARFHARLVAEIARILVEEAFRALWQANSEPRRRGEGWVCQRPQRGRSLSLELFASE